MEEQELQGQQTNENNDFDITSLNQALGEEFNFEDVGSLKDALSYRDKYSELEERFNGLSTEKEDLHSQYEELNGKYGNVVDYFSGDGVINKLYGDRSRFERIELEKTFPDKDPSVVSRVYSSDLNSMSAVDKILLADKLNVRSDISDKGRLDAIYQSLGIEDPSDLTETDKYKLARAESQANQTLNQVKNFKPEEPKFDFKAESEKIALDRKTRNETLTGSWSKNLDEAIAKYDGSRFFDVDKDGNKTELLHFQVSDKFKEETLPGVVNNLVAAGIEPTQENIQFAVKEIDKIHVLNNIDKIVKSAILKSKTETEDSVFAEEHNTKKPNETQAPVERKPSKTTMTLMEAMRQRAGTNK